MLLKNRYLFIMISLVLFLIVPPFINNRVATHFIFSILFTLILLLSSLIFYEKKKYHIITICAVLAAIIITWLERLLNTEDDTIRRLTYIILFCFFTYVTIILFRFLIKIKEVNRDAIFVSISIYFLMGIIGGLVFIAIHNIYPSAYSFPGSMPVDMGDFIYFSFVTMTTLGYGDITPAIQESQMLAILWSIFGQFYLAIIVAVMVGKFIAKPK